jgi:2-oxoglutarate dehydrogenase E2 component (dihydrolipoamide succinyltransferase)
VSVELRIPGAGDAATEAQLVEWIAADGDLVREGEAIYLIESDKAVLEIAAPASGTLRIAAEAGAILPIGHLIGRIE